MTIQGWLRTGGWLEFDDIDESRRKALIDHAIQKRFQRESSRSMQWKPLVSCGQLKDPNIRKRKLQDDDDYAYMLSDSYGIQERFPDVCRRMFQRHTVLGYDYRFINITYELLGVWFTETDSAFVVGKIHDMTPTWHIANLSIDLFAREVGDHLSFPTELVYMLYDFLVPVAVRFQNKLY